MEPTVNQSVQSKNFEGWSWAGFMLDPFLIIGARKHKMLFWYLFLFIPFINLIFLLVFKIYLGIKGSEIVNASQAFSNDDERRGFMKGLNHAGFISFILCIVLFVLGICLFTVQLFLFSSSVHTMQSVQQYPVQFQDMNTSSTTY